MMILPNLYRVTALVLSFNYFFFQVELFEKEYEANHPTAPDNCSISIHALSWESFDKDNAPQPFIFNFGQQIDCVLILGTVQAIHVSPVTRHDPIRDKSPPISSPLS